MQGLLKAAVSSTTVFLFVGLRVFAVQAQGIVPSTALPDEIPPIALGQMPPSMNPLPTPIAASSVSLENWEAGYINEQGQYQAGEPAWGELGTEGGSFSVSGTASQRLVRRWISPFTGQINLNATFKAADGVSVLAEMRVNGTSMQIQDTSGQGGINLGLIDIKAGEPIDFVFTRQADDQGGRFEFTAQADVPAGLVFVNQNKRVLNPYLLATEVFTIDEGLFYTRQVPYQDIRLAVMSPRIDIRSGPGRNYSLVQSLGRGFTFVFPPQSWAFDNEGQRWFSYDNGKKWISEEFLDKQNPPKSFLLTPVPFDRIVKNSLTVPINVRTGPGTNYTVGSQRLAGDSLSFDAWTRGEMVNEPYGSGDRWYRIVGTDSWVSETVLDGGPPPASAPIGPTEVEIQATHVGMVAEDKVYESASGYAPGSYYDILRSLLSDPATPVPITQKAGVQAQHTLGSFITQSTTSNSTLLPHWHKDIEDDYVVQMWAKAEELVANNKGFLSCSPFCSVAQHTGLNGSYSPVGLIEAIAEQAGLRNGNGFIPNGLQNRLINRVAFSNSQFSQVASLAVPPPQMTPFTPEGFEFYLKNNNAYNSPDNWLDGWLEAVEFMLTDPDGLRFGYKDGNLINEIGATFIQHETVGTTSLNLPNLASLPTPNVERYLGASTLALAERANAVSQCTTPDPTNPVENLFQFMITNRKSGDYKLQLWGKSTNSKAVIGNAEQSALVYADCQPEEPQNPENPKNPNKPPVLTIGDDGTISYESVPEPTTIAGGTIAVICGAWRRYKQKQKKRSQS